MTNSNPSGFSRRILLANLAVGPALSTITVTSAAAQAKPCMDAAKDAQTALRDAKGTKLVMLGTGAGPVPGRKSKMTSHLMLSNGAAYVLDCGLGVTDRIAETGIPFGALRSIFITHHHADHNIEYGPLLIIGWIHGMPLTVKTYGPPPLKQMTEDFLRAYKTTVDFWVEDLKMKPLKAIDVTEVSGAGLVMQDDNVKVSSVVVEHPPVKPSLGYRFDFHDRSIAFSGDTTPLEAVAQMSKGVDILVHEAMYMPALEAFIKQQVANVPSVSPEVVRTHLMADHSPVEEVGRIAQEAGVKTLVLSHLTPAFDSITDDMWRAPAARNFKGKIIVAHDLMVI